ncbi:MAG TPA: hypothetical protein VJP78_16070, partial [Thermoleophilia bacterium]|nr:hypothetical protein [Thermoleophilia bacterium]
MLDVVPRTHPSALRILPGKIPAELTRVDNWVVWRYELRQSKWTKVPYRAADPSSLASSTDPKTWGPFDAAMAAYEHGGLDGIGIVPPADIAIVDLDHTDGRLWAQTIVDRLGSYAEVSPSGQGIRILVRATLPAARKVGAIEAYPGGGKRYCTITGHHLPPSPPVVTDAPDAVADLVADLDLYRQFLAWARQHRAQEKVERLMAGDTTGYTSASESDMALTSLLMSCFHDHATALRVLGLSGLWDEKWLRIDYADRTFAAVGTSPSPSPWQIVQTNSGGR